MVVLENFKIKKEGLNFCIYELVERDEYKKNETGKGALALKTGNRIKEWKDLELYHGKLINAFRRVSELAIERGFNDMENVTELIEKTNYIKSYFDNFCKG